MMRSIAVSKRSLIGRLTAAFFIFAFSIGGASCTRSLGYGLLLWSTDSPSIPSGSVVKVYIKSNIDGVWVVGVPGSKEKVELPLWQLEFVGGKGKTKARAAEFAAYSSSYAEAMQDGLPIRAEPDNGARRVYRLHQGQIVKVLGKAQGNVAMAGETALPGEWLSVLTDDGASGYCFSYRLCVFNQVAGTPKSAGAAPEAASADTELDELMSQVWYPESYKEMIDNRRVDLATFSVNYGFFPGQDTGIVRIVLPGLSVEQPYTSIKKIRDGVWRFEGTSVQTTLRSKSVVSVQYVDDAGAQKSLVFVTLPVDAKDVVEQETERRSKLLEAIVMRGPVFRSENYGTISFTASGAFTWVGFDLLVPATVPELARSMGNAELRLFLDPSLQDQYDGALSLKFDGLLEGKTVDFLYSLEPNGLRLEYAPPSCVDGLVVKQRASSPIVVAFKQAER